MFNEPYNANIPDNAGSDELANLANHHTSNEKIRDTIEDTLPAELQPLHQQLVTIGEEWRSLIPPADQLISYARNMEVTLIPPDTDASLDTTALARQTIDTAIGYVASEPRFSSAHRAENRFRLLVAVAVSLTMVALLAGVFAMFAPDRFAGKDSTTPPVTRATYTPTPASRPTIGPVTGDWVTPPQLSNLPNEPVIAPSDPRIIYQGGTELKRSDDGGTTWRVIPTPSFSGAAVSNMTVRGLTISMVDPNTLEISLIVGLSSPDPLLCPAGTHFFTDMTGLALPISRPVNNSGQPSTDESQTSLASLQPHFPTNGFVSCLAVFASRDGGVHWNQVHAPIGIYGPRGPYPSGHFLQGQGDRLYGVEDEQSDPAPLGFRIVTSTDAANWQLIDAPLIAQHQHICDIKATPTGTTIFALTLVQANGCFDDQSSSLLHQIWRSEDAGAHWQPMGTLSATVARLIAVTPSDTGGWLLYAVTYHTVYVSSDGGATWQQAPQAGIPTGQTPYGPMEGTLADGYIVEAFAVPPSLEAVGVVHITFYAWRAGDSTWRRVSPPITVDVTNGIHMLAIPGAPGRRNELWITETAFASGGYTMHRFDV